MIKPVGYINENGVFFKELTPNPAFNATLTPIYIAAQLGVKKPK